MIKFEQLPEYGQKMSPEARAKMSIAKKGKPGRRQSAETKAKLSVQVREALARKKETGWVHPNTGRPRSLEVRAKISAAKQERLTLEGVPDVSG